jgi:hypothetical protein
MSTKDSWRVSKFMAKIGTQYRNILGQDLAHKQDPMLKSSLEKCKNKASSRLILGQVSAKIWIKTMANLYLTAQKKNKIDSSQVKGLEVG